ncbi:hypothetical protein BaRGS_00003288 [Batillaria attramentaria]|uniref:Prospero domain-containing protein n=1 Tax=Batillaria attramentaria TaxID=370345 RepID=A0ABD0M2D0_9CAEN
MHLRKAKLMFFYTRYPNSGILKIYFPDVSFNKNNTAQLVKWFSNFRDRFRRDGLTFLPPLNQSNAREASPAGPRSAGETIPRKGDNRAAGTIDRPSNYSSVKATVFSLARSERHRVNLFEQ